MYHKLICTSVPDRNHHIEKRHPTLKSRVPERRLFHKSTKILLEKIKMAVKYIMNVCNPYNNYNSQLHSGKTDKARVRFDH